MLLGLEIEREASLPARPQPMIHSSETTIRSARSTKMQAGAAPVQALTVQELKGRLEALVDEVSRDGTRVVVSDGGKQVSAVVSVDDLRRLRRLDQDLDKRRRVLEAVRAPFRDVPSEEIEREGAKAVAEVCAEMRAERERQRATVNVPLE